MKLEEEALRGAGMDVLRVSVFRPAVKDACMHSQSLLESRKRPLDTGP